ncbi:MBL fold metallo-hydrolase [Streptomyces chattanoogensis]|uniref:Metallo-beta-lactamase n=1 Tax=Streptomyces chattanoogensis TaxID=66876 RepID=A0A0N0GXY3_9ACTN|nr:MBL fold metallo-hydrolase [Streptomyces chattanoogensis]KPC61080.1 metallo-beta-lactamase [Streptomyces chattanoogensis]
MTGSRPRRTPLSALRPASFGAEPTGERLARIRRSPQFRDGQFRNPVPIRRVLRGSGLAMARTQLSREARRGRAPVHPIPVHRPAAADWGPPPASGLRITWMGHSSVLAEIDGQRVLFDPVWGERCSPFSWIGPKRMHPVPAEPSELPPVDAVVISHDHYDHLDMPTIRGLAGSGAAFVVPLGVGADLEFWGVPAARITELDWHESTRVGTLTLTATPAQHFCGRGLRGLQHTLWASWVVTGPDHRIFHSGDTGYFSGFAEIGAAHGPFDATMMQVGAYSDFWPGNHTDSTPLPGAWPDIHMTPAQGVRAHLDLQGHQPHGVLLPIHWGTFNLALHPWAQPGEWTKDAAEEAGQTAAFPRPGEPFEPAGSLPTDPWWRAVSVPLTHPWRRLEEPDLTQQATREDFDFAGER